MWSWCFVQNNYGFSPRCAGCVPQGWAVRRVFVISCGPPRTLGCLAFTMPITWRRRRRVREGEQLSSGEQPESEEPRAQILGSRACSKLSPAVGLGPEARLHLGKMIEAAETQQMFWKRPMVCSPGQRDPRGVGVGGWAAGLRRERFSTMDSCLGPGGDGDAARGDVLCSSAGSSGPEGTCRSSATRRKMLCSLKPHSGDVSALNYPKTGALESASHAPARR